MWLVGVVCHVTCVCPMAGNGRKECKEVHDCMCGVGGAYEEMEASKELHLRRY